MAGLSDSYIPYGRQTISEQDIEAVTEVLRSSMLTQGPVVPQFEKAISDKVNAQYGIATNSATSALHIACLALDVGPGDRVWTSPITFVASANCALYCGAKVDFVDIEPATGLMDVEALEQKLIKSEFDGTLPKVVVPVHLTGASCAMEEIARLAQKYGFYVLEDASHAIGGKYKDQPVGTCLYSDICVFSFHPVKIITTGEGGMAMTNDFHLAERMRSFRSHGIIKDHDLFVSKPAGPWSYEQQALGFNYRLTDIQAALGVSQLKRLDNVVEERNYLYHKYRQLLSSCPCDLLTIPIDVHSSVHLAVIRLHNPNPAAQLSLFNALRSDGIGVQLHYSPVHLQPYYQNQGFHIGDYPCSEAYALNSISLPLFPGLTHHQQKRVADSLKSNIGQ